MAFCRRSIMAIPAPAGAAAAATPLALALLTLAGPVRALPASPNQPLAIQAAPGLSPRPCPLVVPPQESLFQPLRIQPQQVGIKNRMGCLSAADARYGPDGCPSRLCGKKDGFQVEVPQGAN
jgi:hypothetical protein